MVTTTKNKSPKYTKRDYKQFVYVLLASAMQSQRLANDMTKTDAEHLRFTVEWLAVLNSVLFNMATMFELDNPNFNSDQFHEVFYLGLCPIVTNEVFEFICETENIDPSKATEVKKMVKSSRDAKAKTKAKAKAKTAKSNTVTKSESSEKQDTPEIHLDALRNLEFPPDTTIQ